jgi:hypothetical protein
VGTSSREEGRPTNVTLSDVSEEEESPAQDQFLAFVAPHEEKKDSYYSEHSDVEFDKLRETRKQHIYELNSLQTEKSSRLLKI